MADAPCLYPRFNNQNAINNVIYIVAVAWIDVRIRRMAMPMSFTFRFTSQIAEQIRTVAFKISWVKTMWLDVVSVGLRRSEIDGHFK